MGLVGALFLLLATILLLGEIVKKPVKLLWKLILNSFLGLVLLVLFNDLARLLGWMVLPVNVLTVLITGILGLPGLILLLMFKLLLVG